VPSMKAVTDAPDMLDSIVTDTARSGGLIELSLVPIRYVPVCPFAGGGPPVILGLQASHVGRITHAMVGV
jgi:hypothetical protein